MSTVFSTEDERHAFVIGFFEVLCPWKPHYRLSYQAEFKPFHEFHYYLAGRGIGFPVLICVIIGLAYLVKEVLI